MVKDRLNRCFLRRAHGTFAVEPSQCSARTMRSLLAMSFAFSVAALPVCGGYELVEIASKNLNSRTTPFGLQIVNENHLYVGCGKAIAHFRISDKNEMMEVENYAFPEINGVSRFSLSPDGQFMVVLSIRNDGSTKAASFRRDQKTGGITPVGTERWVGKRKLRLRAPVFAAFITNRTCLVADQQFLDYGNLTKGTVVAMTLDEAGNFASSEVIFSKNDVLTVASSINVSPDRKRAFAISRYGVTTLAMQPDQSLEIASSSPFPFGQASRSHVAALSPEGDFLYTIGGRFSDQDVLDVWDIQGEAPHWLSEIPLQKAVEPSFRGAEAIAVRGDLLVVSSASSRDLACFRRSNGSQLKLIAKTSTGKSGKAFGELAFVRTKVIAIALAHENRVALFELKENSK